MNSCLPESSACRRLTRSEHVQLLVSMSGVVSSFPQYPPVADTTITHSVMLPGITRYPEITKRGYHLIIKRADIINLVHIMGSFHFEPLLYSKKEFWSSPGLIHTHKVQFLMWGSVWNLETKKTKRKQVLVVGSKEIFLILCVVHQQVITQVVPVISD